jgi:hypothetical protein
MPCRTAFSRGRIPTTLRVCTALRRQLNYVSFMTTILALGVAVRLAAFIIPARRHRRRRFAETNARPTAGNPRRGWRRGKICEAEGLRQGHAGNRRSERRSGDSRGDEKLTHFALRLGRRSRRLGSSSLGLNGSKNQSKRSSSRGAISMATPLATVRSPLMSGAMPRFARTDASS